tara:strand:- start:154 stop:720 length:567 start_codon:yes stop_codon:yes gene_type:complete
MKEGKDSKDNTGNKDSRSELNTLDHDINRLHEISKTISETSLSLRDHITLHQEYVELEKNTRSALKKVEDGFKTRVSGIESLWKNTQELLDKELDPDYKLSPSNSLPHLEWLPNEDSSNNGNHNSDNHNSDNSGMEIVDKNPVRDMEELLDQLQTDPSSIRNNCENLDSMISRYRSLIREISTIKQEN